MLLPLRLLPALLLPVLLAGCIFGGGGKREERPSIRPRASGPVTLNVPTSPDTRQCYADLSRAGIRYSPLPDRDYGGGCLVLGAVQLLDIGTPVANLKSMRCPLARTFAAWVKYGVRPAARQILGSDVARMESMGTYSCRGIVGGGPATGNRLSQHGLANAVDVSAFVLEDGRRITIQNGWNTEDESVREFLRIIHKSACKRFRTVLGPDYNAAHYNHLHLDMGRGPFCR